MAATYTVDASVFVSAFNPNEIGYTESSRLLAHIQSQAIPVIVPVLLLPEVAGALARGRGDTDLARGFVDGIARLPHLVLVPLDAALAQVAADVAAGCRLRGSDAVYAAVALRYGCTLVTLDREQHERVAETVSTCYPADACRELGL